MSGPYTRKPMEAARGESTDSRFDGLHAEASAAVGYSANTLREVRERYRESYAEALARWQDLRDELDGVEREPRDYRPRLVPDADPSLARRTSRPQRSPRRRLAQAMHARARFAATSTR